MENQSKVNNLGIKLKDKRISEGLTYKFITEQLRMSMVTYKKLETGTYKPSLLVLTKISIYLEMSLKETFDLYMNKS